MSTAVQVSEQVNASERYAERVNPQWVRLLNLLESAGWHVEQTLHAPLTPAGRAAERLTRGRSAEFLVYQWSALSRNGPAGRPLPADATDRASADQ